ncbi:MAG: hypothetical protein M3Y78_08510 [Pseudomonadota bacterium]|nr:hypothetical protein [Pseudomonadota bacterium]
MLRLGLDDHAEIGAASSPAKTPDGTVADHAVRTPRLSRFLEFFSAAPTKKANRSGLSAGAPLYNNPGSADLSMQLAGAQQMQLKRGA